MLIVEDDEDSAELLGLMLEHAGYEVRVARSVVTAIASASLIQPHVALIDLGLPDGDGYELLVSLRADACMGRCRFIATTGHGDRETIARSLAAGFDDHLTKPLDLHMLLAAVARGAAASSNALVSAK